MIRVSTMIRQLRDEKKAVDNTISALERLVREEDEASRQPNGARKKSKRLDVKRRESKKD